MLDTQSICTLISQVVSEICFGWNIQKYKFQLNRIPGVAVVLYGTLNARFVLPI